MLQWLQRSLARESLPTQVIGCTEVQTARLASRNQFALHEHWVFVGRHPYKSWSVRVKEVSAAWNGILGNVYKLGHQEINSSASTRIESIKKSVSAYLAKYISKGEKCVSGMIESGYEEFLPSSWVTKSASMLQMFRLSIVVISGVKGREIMETLQDNASVLCRYSRNLLIPIGDKLSCWIAFIGYLNDSGLKMVQLLNC